MSGQLWRWGATVAVPALLAACATPAQRYDAAAGARGLVAAEVEGAGYRHAVYRPAGTRGGDILHIYIEGDGTPLIRQRAAAADPTPRRPLMPALMAADPAPAVVLGRPCYHGHAGDPGCQAALWTEARYSPVVVDSMVAAARRLLRRGGYRGAALLGHSGGGTLAVLMGARLEETVAVVAVAANLDIEAWTARHGLAPLAGSLNPAAMAVPASGPPELIIAGGRDEIVPPGLARAAAERRPKARFVVYEDLDHACCWDRAWPDVLAWISAQASRAGGAD